MKKNLFIIFFAVWVSIWAFLIQRELFVKGAANDYRALLSRDAEGKRSYVTGDRLYEFISFCNKNLPQGVPYKIVGLEGDSIDKRRVAYYLYPHLEKADAEFLLVMDGSSGFKNRYDLFSKLDERRYILKERWNL